jgi:hypothetical protein
MTRQMTFPAWLYFLHAAAWVGVGFLIGTVVYVR